jgi:hypothetical protein
MYREEESASWGIVKMQNKGERLDETQTSQLLKQKFSSKN